MLDILQKFLTSDSLVKLSTIFLTFLSTYFVAKYNLNNPRKLKVKQLQFDNVYLPIYKLIYFDINESISKDKALKYAVSINDILEKNFELVFPQLHTLNSQLFDAINKNTDYQIIFNKISYQISVEYSLLSKALGYPSENSYSLFKRMVTKDKLKSLISWANLLLIFGSPLVFLALFDISKIYLLPLYICVLLVILIKVNDAINNMPD